MHRSGAYRKLRATYEKQKLDPAYAGELAALAALCPGRVEKVSVTAIAIVRSRLAQVTSRGVSQTAISARKVSRRELRDV